MQIFNIKTVKELKQILSLYSDATPLLKYIGEGEYNTGITLTLDGFEPSRRCNTTYYCTNSDHAIEGIVMGE